MDTTSSRLSYLSMTGIDDLEVVKSDVLQIDASLNSIQSQVSSNESNIGTNVVDISLNTDLILDLSNNVLTNTNDITANNTLILDVSNNVLTNTNNIAINTDLILDVSNNVLTNTNDIAANNTLILDVSNNVLTNTISIANIITDVTNCVLKSGDTMTGNLTINDAFVGEWSGGNNFAIFGNQALKANSNDYAVLQRDTGGTLINSKSGQSLDLRINNDTKMSVLSNGNIDINNALSVGAGLDVAGSINVTTNQGQINATNSDFFDIAVGSVDYTLRVNNTTSTFASGLLVGGDTDITGDLDVGGDIGCYTLNATILNLTEQLNMDGKEVIDGHGGSIRINDTGDWDSTIIGGDLSVGGNLTVPKIQMTNAQNTNKICLWSDSTRYSIGMTTTGNSKFGGLYWNVMYFTMNDDSNSGFLWRDSGHASDGSEGAMSLSTDGRLTVANNTRIGYGETTTTDPTSSIMLDVNGDTNITGDLSVGGSVSLDSPVRTDLDMKMVCGSSSFGITENKIYLKSGNDDGGATYLQYQDGTNAVEGVELFVKSTTSSLNRVAQFQNSIIVFFKELYCFSIIKASAYFTQQNVPICNICFGFYQRSVDNTTGLMNHAPTVDNATANAIKWIAVPFRIKVYAISFSTDVGSYGERDYTFQPRVYPGIADDTKRGSEKKFENIDENHYEKAVFTSEGVFGAGEKIGLGLVLSATSGAEICVKLWCYQY